MRIKFTKYERVAGLFAGFAFLCFLAVSVGIAVKKGWLASKVPYQVTFDSAEGLFEGTIVQMSGLRVGFVDSVDLMDQDRVKVVIMIEERFSKRLSKNSWVQQVRPFIIGDKVLEVNLGATSELSLPPGSEIATKETFDVMTILSGRKMGSFLGSLGGLVDNLKLLVEAFGDPERTKSFVTMFDRLSPLILQMSALSKEVTSLAKNINQKGHVETLLANLVNLSTEMNTVLPPMLKEAPEIAHQIPQIIKNLSELTEEFKKLTPAITEVAPELPRASRRAVEALDETVITLKAIQRSFLLSGKVQEVKDQEKKDRDPAGQK